MNSWRPPQRENKHQAKLFKKFWMRKNNTALRLFFSTVLCSSYLTVDELTFHRAFNDWKSGNEKIEICEDFDDVMSWSFIPPVSPKSSAILLYHRDGPLTDGLPITRTELSQLTLPAVEYYQIINGIFFKSILPNLSGADYDSLKILAEEDQKNELLNLDESLHLGNIYPNLIRKDCYKALKNGAIIVIDKWRKEEYIQRNEDGTLILIYAKHIQMPNEFDTTNNRSKFLNLGVADKAQKNQLLDIKNRYGDSKRYTIEIRGISESRNWQNRYKRCPVSQKCSCCFFIKDPTITEVDEDKHLTGHKKTSSQHYRDLIALISKFVVGKDDEHLKRHLSGLPANWKEGFVWRGGEWEKIPSISFDYVLKHFVKQFLLEVGINEEHPLFDINFAETAISSILKDIHNNRDALVKFNERRTPQIPGWPHEHDYYLPFVKHEVQPENSFSFSNYTETQPISEEKAQPGTEIGSEGDEIGSEETAIKRRRTF